MLASQAARLPKLWRHQGAGLQTCLALLLLQSLVTHGTGKQTALDQMFRSLLIPASCGTISSKGGRCEMLASVQAQPPACLRKQVLGRLAC